VIRRIIILALLLTTGIARAAGTIVVHTAAPHNRTVEFVYRLPSHTPSGQINTVMVVFGGRNWNGADALRQLDFSALADRFGLALLSPGFKDDDYWEPEKWSGQALHDALKASAKRCHVKDFTLLYYGYSAGGQCANLFYMWHPERVLAWGSHACGVWGDPEKVKRSCPALITCGIQDKERWEISRNFVQRAGELGWRRMWCELPGEHELSPEALALANAFFTAVLSGEKTICWGDDQTGKISNNADKIEPELRSYLPGDDVKKRWLKQMGNR